MGKWSPLNLHNRQLTRMAVARPLLLLLLPLAAAHFTISSSNATVQVDDYLPVVTLRHAGQGLPLVTVTLDRVEEVDESGVLGVEYDLHAGGPARAIAWSAGAWEVGERVCAFDSGDAM